MQVYEKCSKIRMASRTLPGVPLSLLLEKIKKESSLTKVSLNIREEEYSREHIVKCCALLGEIEDLSSNLKRCDHKARIYKYCFQSRTLRGRTIRNIEIDLL